MRLTRFRVAAAQGRLVTTPLHLWRFSSVDFRGWGRVLLSPMLNNTATVGVPREWGSSKLMAISRFEIPLVRCLVQSAHELRSVSLAAAPRRHDLI